MKNFFNEVYKFSLRSLVPAIVPIDWIILYMVQSRDYCLSPDFISIRGKIVLEEVQLMWETVNNPENSSIDDIRVILFNSSKNAGEKV